MKKVLFVFLSMIVVGVGVLLSGKCMVNAGSTYSRSNPLGFSDEWEKTIYYQTSEGKKRIKFVYGYDKFLINEDYAWSYSYKESHKAGIENDNGPDWTSKKSCSRWAKKEVTHKGKTIYYKVWVDDDTPYYATTAVSSSMKP